MHDVQFNVMHVFAVYVRMYVCKEVCMFSCVLIGDICTVCMYVRMYVNLNG
jgi:hypothetical protein